jgi:hypothetical protein
VIGTNPKGVISSSVMGIKKETSPRKEKSYHAIYVISHPKTSFAQLLGATGLRINYSG